MKAIAIESSPENFLVADGREYTVLHSKGERVTLRCPVSKMTTVVKKSRVKLLEG